MWAMNTATMSKRSLNIFAILYSLLVVFWVVGLVMFWRQLEDMRHQREAITQQRAVIVTNDWRGTNWLPADSAY